MLTVSENTSLRGKSQLMNHQEWGKCGQANVDKIKFYRMINEIIWTVFHTYSMTSSGSYSKADWNYLVY